MPGQVTVTLVDRRGPLEDLEREWDSLLDRTDVASPFLSPGWQFAWLDTYGARHRLFVLVARRDGELVGLWPLGVRRRGLFRVLEPLGAGRSDWLDVPVLSDQREAVLSAFLDYLLGHRRAWDLIELRDVLADSPSLPVLSALSSTRRINLRREPRTVSPYLSLAGTWEQFLQAKRPKFRSNLKYYRRLPEREGHRLEIRRITWDESDPTDSLAAIEQRSWKAREGNLKVSTPLGREFYRRFCRYLAARGWLEVWVADIDAAPVAFVLNIIFGGKVYHYNTCYEETWANISPGLLLHSEAISDAYARQMAEYDFLSGDEPYKERWCSDRRTIDHVTFFHGYPQSFAAQTALVDARWAIRRSKTLSTARQRVLALLRRWSRKRSGADAKAEGASPGGGSDS